MAAKTQNFTIRQGGTFLEPVRWETDPIIYKPITGITQAAPAIVTAITHGLTSGWRVWVATVRGMTQINASNPVKDKEALTATVVDADHVELNTVNASLYSAYVSGGYLQFNTPHSLDGYTARMSIRDEVGGTELLRLDTDNGRIVINDTTKTITLNISAADTAALTFETGTYDLEMVSAGGVVTPLLVGTITVTFENTTT
jgi:hypothetical protein